MPTPPPLDSIRDSRPDAKRELKRLLGIVEQLDSTNAVAERLTARRLASWVRLREMDPPVSWADIARISHIDSVTVIQTMQRHEKRQAAQV